MYEVDKLSLDEDKWRKRAFERELNYILDTKSLKSMNSIHDNKVNNIDECNLLQDVINSLNTLKI